MPTEDAQYHYNQARRLLTKAETDDSRRHELIRLAEVHLNIWRTLRDGRGPGYIRPYWQTNEVR